MFFLFLILLAIFIFDGIWIYSEPRQGSTFKVYPPEIKGDAEEKQRTPVVKFGGSETVLIVEDDGVFAAT